MTGKWFFDHDALSGLSGCPHYFGWVFSSCIWRTQTQYIGLFSAPKGVSYLSVAGSTLTKSDFWYFSDTDRSIFPLLCWRQGIAPSIFKRRKNPALFQPKEYSRGYSCSEIWFYFYRRSISYDPWIFWPFSSTFDQKWTYHPRWCYQISHKNGLISWVSRRAMNHLWDNTNRWRWWGYGDRFLK